MAPGTVAEAGDLCVSGLYMILLPSHTPLHSSKKKERRKRKRCRFSERIIRISLFKIDVYVSYACVCVIRMPDTHRSQVTGAS